MSLLSVCAVSDHPSPVHFVCRSTCAPQEKTPDFEEKTFFGQLLRVLVLELQASRRLDLADPTTIILALIHEVKVTLKDGIYTYKEFGAEEVVDLKAVQCVVGRVKDRGVWFIVDRSDSVVAQVD